MPCLQPFRDDPSHILLYKIASCLQSSGPGGGVTSFNGLTGVVTFTGGDIITLLGFTPAAAGSGVTSFNTRTGAVTLNSADVNGALGFTPENVANKSIDGTFAANSDTLYPSQKAAKTYADAGVRSFNTRTGAVTLLLADVSAVADVRYVLKTGDTMTGALLIGNGTIVADAPVLSLSQTWNNAGVTFNGFVLDLTNTASAGGSNLFNFRVGGETRFAVSINAVVTTLRHDATDFGVNHILRKEGAVGDANGAVANASIIGTLTYSGWNGSVFADGARIQGVVDTVWSGGNRGTNIVLASAAAGSTAVLTILTLSAGVTGITHSFSHRVPYVAKTATYTITNLDHTIDCTANTFTVNLPTAVGITGRIHVIKNSGIGTITIDGNGAELIDGLATQTVVSGGSSTIQSTGAGWIII